jgi:hypothetical protein
MIPIEPFSCEMQWSVKCVWLELISHASLPRVERYSIVGFVLQCGICIPLDATPVTRATNIA